MYIDSFFSNVIAFTLLILILLTFAIITLGVLRFIQLYTDPGMERQLPLIPSENITTHPDIPSSDSKNLALNYIKRNFFSDSV